MNNVDEAVSMIHRGAEMHDVADFIACNPVPAWSEIEDAAVIRWEFGGYLQLRERILRIERSRRRICKTGG